MEGDDFMDFFRTTKLIFSALKICFDKMFRASGSKTKDQFWIINSNFSANRIRFSKKKNRKFFL